MANQRPQTAEELDVLIAAWEGDVSAINSNITLLKNTKAYRFINPADILPHSPWREKECAGAVIYIAPEHVHRGERIVSPPVTGARAVAPDDAAGFLQRAVKQYQASADRANIRLAAERVDCRRQRPRQDLSVIV